MGDKWMGKDILDKEHARELESKAATYEFGHKMPRKEAEEKAYEEYKRNLHVEAAGHHLHGLQAAASAGDKEEGAKHQAMLALHRKFLGENPHSNPSDEVVSRKPNKKWAKFNNHDADSLLGKSELAKGDVIPFPQDRVPDAVVSRKKAKVIGNIAPNRDLFNIPSKDTVNTPGIPDTSAAPLTIHTPSAVGIAPGGKRVYDYNHLLSPEELKSGYNLVIEHAPSKYDDFMFARLKHDGSDVGTSWAYPISMGSGSLPKIKEGHQGMANKISEALKNHSLWVVGNRK